MNYDNPFIRYIIKLWLLIEKFLKWWKNLSLNIRFFLIVVPIFLMLRYGGEMRWSSYVPGLVKEMKASFSGRITVKTMGHTPEISVKTSEDTIHTSSVDHDLYENLLIGDSIYKFPNDDSVYLIRNNYKRKFKYRYISNGEYNNPLWPPEWRHKWMDSTQIKNGR